MQVTPVRNPNLEWTKDEEGRITISVLRKKGGEVSKEKLKRSRRKGLFTLSPKRKSFRLDVLGSIVWELCNGERTVKDIIDCLYREYKLLPIEAEVSLNAYFNQLAHRELIGLIFPKE